MINMRHIIVVLAVAAAALTAGVYMIPSDREQLTMLIRDERDADALSLLQRRYQAGDRNPETMLQLYELLMSFAEIKPATHLIEELVAQHPNDPNAWTLLAKHYADTQDLRDEIGARERLFQLTGSAATAQRLVVLYRLDDRPADEKSLLAKMLNSGTISTDDAQRLGFMFAANGEFEDARRALSAFDTKAAPDSATGRLALFDVLLRLGRPKDAMSMAERWLTRWRDAHLDHGLQGRSFPLERLVEEMSKVDVADTQRIVCNILPDFVQQDSDAFGPQPRPCPPHQLVKSSSEITSVNIHQQTLVVTTAGDEFDRSSP